MLILWYLLQKYEVLGQKTKRLKASKTSNGSSIVRCLSITPIFLVDCSHLYDCLLVFHLDDCLSEVLQASALWWGPTDVNHLVRQNLQNIKVLLIYFLRL